MIPKKLRTTRELTIETFVEQICLPVLAEIEFEIAGTPIPCKLFGNFNFPLLGNKISDIVKKSFTSKKNWRM